MKELSFVVLLLAALFSGKAFAQTDITKPESSALKVTMSDVMVSSVTLKEGVNTVPLPDGRGRITLIKRGDTFSNVVYTDAAGKAIRLAPNNGTGNAPKPECKYPIPDACFGIPNNQNIGMCMCRPTDGASGAYTISLLLPAVQKVREAANR